MSLELVRPCGPIPSANPTPLGSPFPRKGPRVVSFTRCWDRVIRIPTAAEPLMVSLLSRKARVLQRTLEPGPSWRLYCTLKRLPFRARRWRRQATEVSGWVRRRLMVSPPFPKAAVLQRTAEPGPSWCLYCTLRHLPFRTRPVDVCGADRGILMGLAGK